MTYEGKEIPEMDLEKALAASVYLAETGVGIQGGLDEICYRLTVELAKARHLYNKQLLQTAKYKALLKIERKMSEDILDENSDLEEVNEMLKIECDLNARGMDEIDRRFEAAMEVLSELMADIDWTALLEG